MSPLRWWVCLLLLAATTINYLDRVALNQTASAIQTVFQIDNFSYSLLESGFQLAFAVGAFTFGFLVDRFGLRYTYALSVLGWSAAGFLTGYTQSYAMLFACRVTLGLFEAGNWPCGIRTVRTVLPPAERPLGNAFFQSGTGLGAMLTPLIIAACLGYAAREGIDNAWRLPFRVIGLVGIGWLILWWFTVPRRLLEVPAHTDNTAANQAEPFSAILEDRRYWVLMALIIGVNTTWHTFRVWLPLFLEKQLFISKEDLPYFNFSYYAVADVGSWLAGGLVLLMVRLGVPLPRARLRVFTLGILLILPCFALPWYQELGPIVAQAIVLVTGFGALGLFAIYFALSQELSMKHQGKITGTLGCANSLFLASIYPIQGYASDFFGGYSNVLGLAPIPALVSFVVVLRYWPRSEVPPSGSLQVI